jgi:hypothetical protein
VAGEHDLEQRAIARRVALRVNRTDVPPMSNVWLPSPIGSTSVDSENRVNPTSFALTGCARLTSSAVGIASSGCSANFCASSRSTTEKCSDSPLIGRISTS